MAIDYILNDNINIVPSLNIVILKRKELWTRTILSNFLSLTISLRILILSKNNSMRNLLLMKAIKTEE